MPHSNTKLLNDTKLLELIDEFAEKLKQHVLSAPTEPDGETLYEGIFDFDVDDLYESICTFTDLEQMYAAIIYCMVLAKHYE